MGTRYSVVTELMMRLLGLDYVANTLVNPTQPKYFAHALGSPDNKNYRLQSLCNFLLFCLLIPTNPNPKP